MKSFLMFNLPEDNLEYKAAQNGVNLNSAVQEFSQYLRDQYKYNNIETMNLLEVRKKLHEYCSDYLV